MRDKALAAIARHGMLEKGQSVLVALSGGADSVALLHFLHTLKDEWQLKLGALHLNHQLRGQESGRDEAFVRDLCAQLEIPLSVESFDVKQAAKQAGESVEQCGRRLRYDFFERQASQAGAKVATAHTASDNAETMLINLARGTALRGLAGIPPVRGRIIRPLITCTREEIELYCRKNTLSWVDDSTNQSDGHTRNRVRHHVLPLLTRENPRLAERLTHLSQTLRDDADYLDELAIQAGRNLTRPDGSLERAGFLHLAPALKGRVLADLLRTASIPISGELIEGLSNIIATGKGSRQIGGGMIFSCDGESFCIKAASVKAEQDYFSLSIDAAAFEDTPREVEVFPGKRVILSVHCKNRQENVKELQKKGLTYCLSCLDYDKIVNVVTLRGRLPGDKLRPPGRGCAKTLKNLFQENGVESARRQKKIIAADEEGVLWVEGLGPDERAAVTDQTARIAVIEIAAGDDE